MPDKRLDSRIAGKTPRHYPFVGHHEKLITGALYTVTQVALIIGVNSKTMHSRMRGKIEITNKEIRQTDDTRLGPKNIREGLYNRLESKGMKKSDKWLRVKL